MGGEAETPEEVELAWQAQNPEGEIIHVESDDEGNISSVNESPYGEDDEYSALKMCRAEGAPQPKA